VQSELLAKAQSAIPKGRGGLERARKAAARMRDPKYGLREYYDDIQAAFPEMRLYFLRGGGGGDDSTTTTSGIEGKAEYLRTVGAFFAVYWLARIGIDGERGFSYGVDEKDEWQPYTLGALDAASATAKSSNSSNASKSDATRRLKKLDPQAAFFSMSAGQRARAFCQSTSWGKLLGLLVDAGVLVKTADGRSGKPGDYGEYKVVVDRMVGLLALTAIHDLMKMDCLLPTVQPEHSPYDGFKAGDRINDHDIALGYVLEHFPHTLPSFRELPLPMQQLIRFTQVKISFNHMSHTPCNHMSHTLQPYVPHPATICPTPCNHMSHTLQPERSDPRGGRQRLQHGGGEDDARDARAHRGRRVGRLTVRHLIARPDCAP
jgi:hypothetical protein